MSLCPTVQSNFQNKTQEQMFFFFQMYRHQNSWLMLALHFVAENKNKLLYSKSYQKKRPNISCIKHLLSNSSLTQTSPSILTSKIQTLMFNETWKRNLLLVDAFDFYLEGKSCFGWRF